MKKFTLSNGLLIAIVTTLALSGCGESGAKIGQKFVPADDKPAESAAAAEAEQAAAAEKDAVAAAPKPQPKPAQETASASAPSTKPSTGSSSSSSMQAKCAACGIIESISAREVKGEGSGLGAAAGAVLGGIIGHQFGSGSGNKAATVAGAVGGAVAGNEIEKRKRAGEVYDYNIVMSDGTRTMITQPNSNNFYVGDKVQIVDGQMYKI